MRLFRELTVHPGGFHQRIEPCIPAIDPFDSVYVSSNAKSVLRMAEIAENDR
jgi:hypothetical protein